MPNVVSEEIRSEFRRGSSREISSSRFCPLNRHVTPGQGFQTGEAWAYREIIDTLLASEDMMMTSNG